MLARDDVVHLVAVESVGARNREQPDDHEAGNQQDWPGNGQPYEAVVGGAGGGCQSRVPVGLDRT